MKENYLIDKTNFCGKCPECDHDWDGGLNRDNKPTSKLVRLESSDGDSWNSGETINYQCPNCNVAWDSETGERTEKYKAMLADETVLTLGVDVRRNLICHFATFIFCNFAMFCHLVIFVNAVLINSSPIFDIFRDNFW